MTKIRVKYLEFLTRLGYPISLINKAWIKINELHPEEAEFTKEVICRDLLKKQIKKIKLGFENK